MKKYLLLFLWLPLVCGSSLRAQIAGLDALTVLDLSSSARTAGLGMDYLSVAAPDLNLGLDNPSLIDYFGHACWAMNYTNLFAGANFGSLAYGRHFQPIKGDFLFALRFNSYGSFDRYDETETQQGTFFAADYMLSVGYGLHIDSSISIGVNFKPIFSQYERYKALAIALDVCGTYQTPSRNFSLTLMGRNFGAQLLTFNGTTEQLPFELSMAVSYKVSNAPFRLYGQLSELQKWDLRYNDPLNPLITYDPYTGTYSQESWIHRALDQSGRHLVIGVEFDMKKVFFLRLGYNYRQAQEIQGTQNLNFSGFSFGVGLHKKRFCFDYAHRNYHLGQGLNYLSLTFKI